MKSRVEKIVQTLGFLKTLPEEHRKSLVQEFMDRLTVEEYLLIGFAVSDPLPEEEETFLMKVFSTVFEAVGVDLQKTLIQQPGVAEKMEQITPLMKELASLSGQIYQRWNSDETRNP